MKKELTCIECPQGCTLSVDIENCKVVKVTGNKCPKGLKYAADEIENPVRMLAATVLARGLPLKMIPVRTDRPIPKDRIMDAMRRIKKIRVDKEVRTGDVIAADLPAPGVNLIATRDALSSQTTDHRP